MIKTKLLLCAEGIIVDQRSNNVSVFAILEQFNPPSLPFVIAKMVVLSVLQRDEGDPEQLPITISFKIAGSEIANETVIHNFQGKKRSRNILTIGGLPIEQPGTLEISTYIEDKKQTSYTIEVNAPKKAIVQKASAKNTTSEKATVKNM